MPRSSEESDMAVCNSARAQQQLNGTRYQ